MKLLNSTKLAQELGIGRTAVAAMKKLGFQFQYGMKTTKRAALDWLREHPSFRQREAYPRRSAGFNPRPANPPRPALSK